MRQSQDIFGQVQQCVRALRRQPADAGTRVRQFQLPGGMVYLAGAGAGEPRAGEVLVCCVFPQPAELIHTESLPAGALGLTRTQERVATLLARGLTNAEIAAELGSSPCTVRRHTEHIFLRLGVKRRRDVAVALQDRLAKAIGKRLAGAAHRELN
jgi:DNA-binding CsgD family transcriptional regulator